MEVGKKCLHTQKMKLYLLKRLKKKEKREQIQITAQVLPLSPRLLVMFFVFPVIGWPGMTTECWTVLVLVRLIFQSERF